MTDNARVLLKSVRELIINKSPVELHTKPDFLIVGVQKAGTTSLYEWIQLHPDIWTPHHKELHFFDRPDTADCAAMYRAQFPSKFRRGAMKTVGQRRLVAGEATPYYIFHPFAAKRIKAMIPGVRIIIVLRNPIERTISHYWHNFHRGVESLTLEQALDAESERLAPEYARVARGEEPSEIFKNASYVARSLYAEQLSRWYSLFDAEQILVLNFGRLTSNPHQVVEETLQFLGVRQNASGKAPRYEPKNRGLGGPVNPQTLDYLAERFRLPNQELADRFGIVTDETQI